MSGRSWRQAGPAGAFFLGLALGVGCSTSPPRNPDDICDILSEKRSWYRSARRSFERWGMLESVQLAVIHQESRFEAGARPARRKILWIFPGPRLSSANGYGQVGPGGHGTLESARVDRPVAWDRWCRSTS